VPRRSGAGQGCKILDQDVVKPHKARYYLEQRDPDFEAITVKPKP
jgi:hypothetical protein